MSQINNFYTVGIKTTALVLAVWVVSPNASHHLENLRPSRSLPPHVVGQFRDPSVFQQSTSGEYLIFDRGSQSVYRVDRQAESATEIVNIGPEEGHILGASAFDVGPNADSYTHLPLPTIYTE